MVLTKLDLPKSLCLRRGVDYYFSPQRRLFLSSSAGLDVKVVSDPRGYFVERLNLEVTSKAFYLRAANFYRVLSERMEGMFRLNGEPEINHLARIFNMMRGDGIRDEALLLAALGHDAIEDGYLNYSEIAEYLGKEAADLIEGETKLSREIAPQRREVGSLVKWIEAAHKDPRIIILKAYDNFDNWRDQEVFFKIPGKENRPFQHAEETMLIYGPILRYALGFWQMWVCLEDRALKYFDPEYKDNIQLYNSAVRNSFDEIERVAAEIQKELQMNQIKALVRHQVKHYSEIFSKAKEKNLPVKSLLKSMPLFVHYISVVVDGDLLDCHRARGIVDIFGGRTGMFFPETWGINNLIKARGNGYRALHTYVSIPGSGVFMIGYTTREFDLVNKWGVLAQGFVTGFQNGWARPSQESLSRLWEMVRGKGILTAKQIRDRIQEVVLTMAVYTPKGEAFRIQGNATVLDYLLMQKCFSVEKVFVNGQKVNLDYGLKEGDIVEFWPGEKMRANPLWLLMVRTHEAAREIRNYLKTLPEGEVVKMGIEALNSLFTDLFLTWENIRESSQVLKVVNEIYKERLGNQNNLFFEKSVGLGEIDVEEFKQKFVATFQASLLKRKEKGEVMAFAIVFKINQDRVGLQQEFTSYLKQINMNIIKNQSAVNQDGSAIMAYVFDIYSSLQRCQIENIIKRLGGEILATKHVKLQSARGFRLTKWLASEKIKI